jgi:uncharacterized surface protein with fasciclin (FAS1) repeats
MFKIALRPLAITAALLAGSVAAYAANPMVGGGEMLETKNIVENAVNSKDHTTLVAAVKAAGLVETLSGAGPFTVFAPTNEAFEKLPAGTVDTLLKPENKDQLTKVLTCHVVGKAVMADAIVKMIADEGQGHGRQGDADRREWWRLDRDHRRRQAVERRDPRGRRGDPAEDVSFGGGGLRAPCSMTGA